MPESTLIPQSGTLDLASVLCRCCQVSILRNTWVFFAWEDRFCAPPPFCPVPSPPPLLKTSGGDSSTAWEIIYGWGDFFFIGGRVRRSFSLKAKKSEKSLFSFRFEAKKMFFFLALFACKRNTSKSENNESETKRTKRKIAIPVKV